jgi:AraC-like DNA-binding protein
MDYAEIPAPAELRHLAKAAWTLSVGGTVSDSVDHVATSDGCIEIIRRLKGRSSWGGNQPLVFVAGLTTHPAVLRLSAASEFIGLRLWPWAWNAIGRMSSHELVDRWADLATAAPGFTMPDNAPDALAAIDPQLLDPASVPLIEAVLGATSVSEIAERSGRSHRYLQRWFERHVGVPPRIYLRLLRFSNAFDQLPKFDGSLARHAADHGFADQSHMAREFRSMSGLPAGEAKKKAIGPFL